MPPNPPTEISPRIWNRVELAASAGRLTGDSVANLALWLTDPRYAASVQTISNLIAQERWIEIDAAFWTTIPFGTAGRRGLMYPVGPNAINDRTMGESAAGLAVYLTELFPDDLRDGKLRCAIGYDTRHRSRHFAELCAEIMLAAGIKVAFLDGYRATPELAMTVRTLGCRAGIMITASHNPPSDNAIKVFWQDGAQIRPPFDAALIDRVAQVQAIPRARFSDGVANGMIEMVQARMDREYPDAVLQLSRPGPRDVEILYSPLHGVGRTAVEPVLIQAGFADLEVYGPQAMPDGDFPNVPGHVANPENPAVFDDLIAYARSSGAELILASDPDADRIGVACPESLRPNADWKFITGNQIGALLAEYLLARLKREGKLDPRHFVVKTFVTCDMLPRLAEHYGCRAFGHVLTGFKWIGLEIDERGPEWFVLGTEEAHGYLAGTHIRDKDAAVAALLLAEFAAEAKQAGRTLYEELHRIYRTIGCHQEAPFSLTLPGANGMQRMKDVLAALRAYSPATIGGIAVKQLRDYERATTIQFVDGILDPKTAVPLDGPQAEMLFFDLAAPGHSVGIRPSGTEPKLKLYLFTALSPAESQDVAAAENRLQERLAAMQLDLRKYIENVH